MPTKGKIPRINENRNFDSRRFLPEACIALTLPSNAIGSIEILEIKLNNQRKIECNACCIKVCRSTMGEKGLDFGAWTTEGGVRGLRRQNGVEYLFRMVPFYTEVRCGAGKEMESGFLIKAGTSQLIGLILQPKFEPATDEQLVSCKIWYSCKIIFKTKFQIFFFLLW